MKQLALWFCVVIVAVVGCSAIIILGWVIGGLVGLVLQCALLAAFMTAATWIAGLPSVRSALIPDED